jgi:uncharacterized protein involved in outer membrane biogenesis
MRFSWSRWRVRAAWAAAAIALYAIVGFVVVPRIARAQIVKQARAMLHREATVARVRFNPFTFVAIVEGLDLKDRDGAELFHLDRLRANFETSGIFRRAFRFRELTLDGPKAVARIGGDGRLSIADLFEKKPDEPPAGPKSSLPRVLIDRFALRAGQAQLLDESRTPRYTETFAPLDLELHGLTTIPDESGDHTIVVGLGEGARIRWSGRQMVEPLRFEGEVKIAGIRLPHVWEYFESANPLEIRSGKADVTCSYDVRRDAAGAVSAVVKDVSLALHDLAARPRAGGDDWIAVPLLEMSGGQVRWPEAQAEVQRIHVKDPHVLAWLDPKGAVNWQTAIPPATGAPAGGAPESQSKRWAVKIGTFEIAGASAHVEDRTFQPPVAADITDAALTLDDVTTDPKAPIPITFSARINGGGQASVSGTVVPETAAVDLDVNLRELDLRPFVPYAIHLPGLDLRSALASASGKLRTASGSPKIQFDGGAELARLQVAGAGSDRLVACDRTAASGIRVTVGPERVRIANIELHGAYAKLDIDHEGNVNLKKIASTGAAEQAEPAPPKAPGAPLDLAIGTIAIVDASAEYTDESVILPFGTEIHAINGSLKDLSLTSPVAARLGLEGRISDAGYFKANGTLRVAAPFAATDVTVIFRGVNMPELTPYSAQFAGYSIERGNLDVDIRYRIQDGHLVGDHRVVAKELTLGPKVEGAKGPGLPVRLAISLLKDKDGKIDLEVPIEGTVDSPEFNYKSVFWQAFKTILGNVAAAPFRAIGRMFGADKEDLELVGFAAGESALPAPEQDKLTKLGPALAAKAELSLEIEGRFDPVADVDAIRRARLEQRIDAKREGAPSVESIVESLYVETFSPERLEAERQKFAPGAAAAPPAAGSKTQGKKTKPLPPKEGFDAAGFYDALRSQLLEADVVTQQTLDELSRARAASIQAALTAPGGLDPARVKLAQPAPVKRKKQGSELVASEMTLSAGD